MLLEFIDIGLAKKNNHLFRRICRTNQKSLDRT
jgi:hypothetical protein